jgi:cytochrome P450
MLSFAHYTFPYRYRAHTLPREGTYSTDRLPPSLPAPAALQTWGFWRAPHAYLELCRRRYGSPFTINALGKPPMIFMSRPAEIAGIISASTDVLHPGAGARVIRPLVGEHSFMLLEEPGHMRVRKTIMPAYHSAIVAEHTAMVREVAEREIADWPDNQAFAAHPRLRSLTLRVILTSIFGNEDTRISELHIRLLKMLTVTGSLPLQEPQLRIMPRWRGVWRSFLSERTRVDTLMSGLIDDEVHAKSRESGALALLLGAGDEPPSTEEVRDHLMSLVLAGHETTASQLAWALQLLSHDRAVLATLTDDVDHGGDAYMTATVQEVLRHRPVFLFAIPRVLARPVEIVGRRYRPPGQLVGCIHLMHHDPALYPAPHRFRPERFLDCPPRPGLFMPWGGGRKRCPGHSLATLEMQIVLREALTRWSLLPAGAPEAARWRSVIVTPEHGCRIVVHPRTRQRTPQKPDGGAP